MENHQNGSAPDGQTTPARTLAELEQIVETGLARYQEAGNALGEINSRGLYKTTHPTFEAYLKEKWGISRAHGYRLINAAKVAEMSPIGDKPANEHRARKKRTESKPTPKQSVKAESDLSTISGRINRTTLVEVVANTPIEEVTVETEFEKFKNILWEWEMDLSNEDYLRLVTKIYEHTDEIRIKNRYTDDVLIAREEARLDAAEAAAEMAVAV